MSAFLPSTRFCGYFQHSVCRNCYAYGAGGPCSNCALIEGILVGPVDWEEFRVGLDLPMDYQEFLNTQSPNNHYVNIETFPPNGTWEEVLFKHEHHLQIVISEYDDFISIKPEPPSNSYTGPTTRSRTKALLQSRR
jgi:hypothetical protein